jgi:hypothetical protein
LRHAAFIIKRRQDFSNCLIRLGENTKTNGYQTRAVHNLERLSGFFLRLAIFGSRFSPGEPLLICPNHDLAAAISTRFELFLKTQDQRIGRCLCSGASAISTNCHFLQLQLPRLCSAMFYSFDAAIC